MPEETYHESLVNITVKHCSVIRKSDLSRSRHLYTTVFTLRYCMVSHCNYQTKMIQIQRKITLHTRMDSQHFAIQSFLICSGTLDSLPKHTSLTVQTGHGNKATNTQFLQRVREVPLVIVLLSPPRWTVVCAASRVPLKSMWRMTRKTHFQTAHQLSPRSHAKRSLPIAVVVSRGSLEGSSPLPS